MSEWHDLEGDMPIAVLDDHTIERMLTGAVAPPDAPPGYAPVAAFLAHLADIPLAGEVEVSVEAHAISRLIREQPAPARLRARGATALALASVLVAAFSGLAYAHELPRTVDDATDSLLRVIGISHHDTRPPARSGGQTLPSGAPSPLAARLRPHRVAPVPASPVGKNLSAKRPDAAATPITKKAQGSPPAVAPVKHGQGGAKGHGRGAPLQDRPATPGKGLGHVARAVGRGHIKRVAAGKAHSGGHAGKTRAKGKTHKTHKTHQPHKPAPPKRSHP